MESIFELLENINQKTQPTIDFSKKKFRSQFSEACWEKWRPFLSSWKTVTKNQFTHRLFKKNLDLFSESIFELMENLNQQMKHIIDFLKEF